ncbi:hypothetical protein RHGRI_035575 [Rhododendron griersonianum]|uniref:Uncharacterized protein n=1 Tax=Rhododendron griersonianum TaxID=479676 RepID=A0AAV6HMM5_9ERIC|nr:hypothetical protein RHGRI_035575 [Rhododendron griersonianum]
MHSQTRDHGTPSHYILRFCTLATPHVPIHHTTPRYHISFWHSIKQVPSNMEQAYFHIGIYDRIPGG